MGIASPPLETSIRLIVQDCRVSSPIPPTAFAQCPDISHYLLSHPHLTLCTENLTPFLQLLPSKGLSGLSRLLAQPGIIFSWGFKAEGIKVVMPSTSCSRSDPTACKGMWRGWWEGVVDLVPEKGGSRAFSIESLFRNSIPSPFPEASSSLIRLISSGPELRMEPDGETRSEWIDGGSREVTEWNAVELAGRDVHFWWQDEGSFAYRQSKQYARADIDSPTTPSSGDQCPSNHDFPPRLRWHFCNHFTQ